MRLLHISLIVSDLQRARAFYEGVLGLSQEKRPDLGFEGYYYALSGGQQLHLMKLANPYAACVLPEHGGRDRHIAFAVEDIQELEQKLQAACISFTRSRSGRAALFCRDPDGNALEFCAV